MSSLAPSARRITVVKIDTGTPARKFALRFQREMPSVQSVLAVDDSASIRSLVNYVLGQAGFDVVLAEDGQEALEYEYAQEHTVDLVLTDINMPNLDGIGLIKGLRALPNYRFVPLLVLTTESGTDMKMAGKAAGATGWIVKPFEPQQLVATIEKVLS